MPECQHDPNPNQVVSTRQFSESVTVISYGQLNGRKVLAPPAVEINQAERQLQLAHFDSLDTKAGLVLGFAGVLIALGNSPATLAGTASTILAALAAVASVASSWPRKFASIDPIRLGDYAGAELEFTHLTLLDTLEVMLVETTEMLELKSRRLKLAFGSPDRRSGSGFSRPIVWMIKMAEIPQT